MEKGGGLIRAFMVGICAQSCLNYFYFYFFFSHFSKTKETSVSFKRTGGVFPRSWCDF